MTTTTENKPMTAFQLHSDLAEAHSILCDCTDEWTSPESYAVIGRAMAHIRGQMSALTTVILWGAK